MERAWKGGLRSSRTDEGGLIETKSDGVGCLGRFGRVGQAM